MELSMTEVLVFVICMVSASLATRAGTFVTSGGAIVNGTLTSDEKRLIKVLLDEYVQRGVYGRPVLHVDEIIHVHFGLNLIQIMELDEKNQVLTLNVWDRYEWNDTFLKWNPEDFGNVTDVRVPAEKIWTPDIKLYNYADERIFEHRDALAIIYSNGAVLWMPQAVYKSSCSIDIKHFPFDEQYCTLKFGSWTYNGLKLDVDFAKEISAFDMSDYIPNMEWEIVKNVATKNVFKYTCCPEIYPDLTFTLTIRRNAVFYNYILILPCVLLSTLTLVLFWIPPESPAKMQLGMNIFVAFFVLLLLLEESIPPAAASMPLIGAYYCLNMILITLSSFLNVIVVNLSFYGARGPVPSIIRKVFIEALGKALCISAWTRRRQKRNESEDRPIAKNRRPIYAQRYDSSNGFNKWSTENWKCSAEHLVQGKVDKDSMQSNNSTPLKLLDAPFLEREVRDINARMKQWTEKSAEKERKEMMAREWKSLAMVLDRIFFLMYLTAVIVSLATIFPSRKT